MKTLFPVGADLCVRLIDRAEAQALALKTTPPHPESVLTKRAVAH